jgi:hypothetical protein
MGVDGRPGRFTREDLIRVAREMHLPLSASRLYEWISLGLVDEGDSPGRGPGRGRSAATWPPAQAALLFVMLSDRHVRGVEDVATLCNRPVFLWLIGDSPIPLQQVQRAMRTWYSRTEGLSWDYQLRRAESAAERLAGRRLTRDERVRLAQPIAEGAYLGEAEPEHVADAAADVVGSEGARETGHALADRVRRYRHGRTAIVAADDESFLQGRDVWRASYGPDPAQTTFAPATRAPESLVGVACLSFTEALGEALEADAGAGPRDREERQ